MIELLPLETRKAELLEVRFPQRTIELVVMPYETETLVPHQGRMVREVVARGAFDGIQRRSSRVSVNRDHDVTRSCGKAVSFHPSRREGLVAEIKIANTDLGKDTLEMCDEGMLDASAGFRPMQDKTTGKNIGEQWPERNLRRLTNLWLGHIALVPDPAYETAKVLAVRHGANESLAEASERPNLEQLEIERLRREYAILDDRYRL